jgi:hypothetical protein
MKIDQFSKYKKLVESKDPSLLGSEEAMRIYNWMETSGRIDEGFWGSIWGWLKRNFSPTSMKIHKLADEFGAEFSKELKAEFDRKEDSSDKAAQMRSSWAGKISGDIEERMKIIAEDDPEYQELVRYLINKKTLEAKRDNLKYLDEVDRKSVDRDLRKKEKENEEGKTKAYAPFMREDKAKMEELRKQIREEIKKHLKVLSVSFESDSEKQKFVDALCNYAYVADKKYKKGFDFKTTNRYLKDIVNFVSRDGTSLRTGRISTEESMQAVLDEIVVLLNDDSGLDLPRLLKKALSDAKANLVEDDERESSSGSSVEKAVTTSHTTKVMDKEDVEDAVETAAEETGKEDPSKKEILSEIESAVKDHFSASNISVYVDQLNDRIDAFNKLNEADRKGAMKDHSYVLNKEMKLDKVNESDVEKLIVAFIDVVGLIYPYFQSVEEKTRQAVKITSRFLFEIYAIEKDQLKKLLPEEKVKLLKNMKEKYPQSFV